MKVCTDSCLFGAWLNRWISDHNPPPEYALDIGTGTGLLSMMMAQRNAQLKIDAIEIEENAFRQASDNIDVSIFKHQIQTHHSSLHCFQNVRKYDLIFSNPPFFENDLKSIDLQKNLAKHEDTLTLAELIKFIQLNLSITGSAAILIPFHRTHYLIDTIKRTGFFIEEIVHVKQTTKHDFFRSMLFFSRNVDAKANSKEMTIKDEENKYTEAFIELLQPFYLNI